MNFTRVAPGPQLAAGRLRVDAARAIAKLREYQLADRTAWILEAIRAAVASNATRIELRGDANDIWLAWDGAAWPAEDLPRLFDELVSPEPTDGRHHLRLLAAGVNSALGMNPAYVDVIAIGDTATHRARFTPDVLVESSDLGESPLRRIVAEPIDRPLNARPGMLVHLRRRVSLEVLSYLLHAPPELALARAACQDLAVPFVLGDEVLGRANVSRDVLRVPLGEALDGFIAAVDPAHAVATQAVIEIAERGVVLARYELDLFGSGVRRAPVPIRVFVDAPRMPTNASRSQVRRQDYPILAAEQRAIRLVPELVGRLAAEIETPRVRAAAIALLATDVAIGTAGWENGVREEIRKPLTVLAKLPLVHDAVGTPRPLVSAWNGLVHTGREPFDAELAPWLSDVLWISPDDPADRLVQHALLDGRALRRRVRWARRQHSAHRRFYDHRPQPATLAPRTKPRIRAPLGVEVEGSCVPQALFEGTTGEVCLDGDPDRGGELVVLLEGRQLERIHFDSPLAFVVVIDSKRVTPADRYRGVVRDARYREIERAMRAGIVRAVEALFVASPKGVELGAEAPETDIRLVRAVLPIAGELGLAVRGPLTIAPVWLAGETRVSLVELAKSGVIGVVRPGALEYARAPAGRLVIEATDAERRMLTRIFPNGVVGYDRARAPDPRVIVHQLLKLGANALIVREGDVVGAIAPAQVPSLTLYHMGTKLESRDYVPRLFSCAIALDAPALVPSADWQTLADDAGVGARTYLAWEIELVRAAANALAGDPPEALLGRGTHQLESELGRALCTAVLQTDPRELFGEALLAKLRGAPIVAVHGDAVPRSLDELAALPGTELAYVSEPGVAIPGFTAVVAGELIARALAKLVGRKAHDATGELEERRRAALFALRLATHRTQLPRPVALPDAGLTVPVTGAIARGVVGVGSGALAVEVFVEGRPFTRVQPRPALPGVAPVPELPLVAAIEVALEHCGATFDGLPYTVIAAIAGELREAATDLVVALATRQPLALAIVSPARTLLVRWLAQSEPSVEALQALRAAPILVTVQGTRVSIEEARQPRGIVSIATWQDQWVADDTKGPLDAPIVFVPEGESETHAILAALHGGPVRDVTEDVRKLQAQRRMARGLLPTPKVRGIPNELVRELGELGELGAKLGPGEIGLASPVSGMLGESMLLIHDHGVLRDQVTLDVMPPIRLAIEAPELVRHDTDNALDLHARLAALGLSDAEPHPMSHDAQALAVELVLAVTREWPLLPRSIRRGVMRAWLARRLPDLDGVPLFETDGPVLDHVAIAEQLALFGNVWTVASPLHDRPLDDRRRVVQLAAEDLTLAREHRRPFIDAAHELALDAIARTNRARPAATELVIWRDGVLATTQLTGDGVTGPRGVVGVLAPGMAAHHRGVLAHREMRPFGGVADPCKWPTIAAIDDARLEPDRTWATPERRGAWLDVVARIREASERALASIVEPPPDALVVDRIDARTTDGLQGARNTQLRGLLWLTDAPDASVEVVNSNRPPIARWDGVAGRLFAFTPDPVDLDAVLATLFDASHARLLRMLLARKAEVDPDVVAVQAAHGLAAKHILPRDARGIAFDCFAPRALEPAELAALFGGTGSVPAVTLADDAEPGVTTFVDDDSPLARAVRVHLGPRIRRLEPTPFAPTPAAPMAAPRVRDHVLGELVRALDQRLHDLGISGFRWEIIDREDTLARFDTTIRIGGTNRLLHAVASAHAANSPWAPASIDAVAAHVVTILNVALTEITDATESSALGALLARCRR